MMAYKLSEKLYRVPSVDYSNGEMIDGYVDIGPDHPDFKKWTKFVVPMPDQPDKGAKASPNAHQQQRAELSRWERKALRRLRESGTAACAFESDLLDEETRLEVAAALSRALTVEGVRRVFAQAVESLEDHFPPVYHTTPQAWERRQIAQKWKERRVKAEREA